jgi:hypothetical protein
MVCSAPNRPQKTMACSILQQATAKPAQRARELMAVTVTIGVMTRDLALSGRTEVDCIGRLR